MSREWDWMDGEDYQELPIKKIKRIKNEFKRNQIKNNRSRLQGGGTTDKGLEGSDY